jgi:polysaccharide pyruvyl transferase CsaB
MQRAVLCGYYGMGNGGDEALLASLLQMLPSHVQPLVLSANPKATEILHRVESCDRYSVWSLLNAFKRSDVFIWGGGSLMQDATSARNPIYYGGLMGLARGMGLKTVAWAQGIGPLHRPLSRWITKRAFHACDRITVRDSGSAQLLADWQIPCLMAPDPVWALKAESIPHLSSLPAPRIAVMLRSHPLLTKTKLACLIEALRYLQTATNAHILLVPFQPSKDGQIAEQIHANLSAKSTIFVDDNPLFLKGIFQNVEMAIAMRLHGLIMAAAEGCRCSAISYDPKVTRLMTDLDISGWELAELPDDPASICREWLELFANGDPLSSAQINSLVDRALIHAQVLAEL